MNNSKHQILLNALSVSKSLPTGSVSVSDVLNHRAGVFSTIVTMRDGKVRKAFQGQANIRKAVIFKQARIGVTYDNKADVKEGRADGSMPSENQGLKWGEYMDGSNGKIILHKGKTYLVIDAFANSIETIWYMDGKEVTKESIRPYLLASEFSSEKREAKESFRNVINLDQVHSMV